MQLATTLCVSEKKRHPLYVCNKLVRQHTILPIARRNRPQRIWNEDISLHTARHISFHKFVL